jgi:hypothetical protein
MENAAHAESLNHEVHRTPLAVQPVFEYRKTPDNYRRTYVGPDKLPGQIKVWRVQNTQRGNVVAWGSGFEDSPDAEILAIGFNHGKAYGDVGIGRQANVLQWGYSDPPSQMTEAGRRLFLNCIHYIQRFDGKAPLVRQQIVGRTTALLSRPDGVRADYRENLELIYWDKGWRIDTDLKTLGLTSNRKVESLRRLIELLDDAQHAATARKLLSRYTECSFETPAQWRQWFEENRDRFYFTDVGGYKFKVAPPGYLAAL